MTIPAAPDPYLLPLPDPNTPVVLPHLVGTLHAHLNACYADDSWPVAPLSENPSAGKKAIHWRHCPEVFQGALRFAAWNLINGELRPTYLKARGTHFRGRLSPNEIVATVRSWLHLTIWLEPRDINSLTQCDTNLLDQYAQHLREQGGSREHTRKQLGSLTRLWALDQHSARPCGIGKPPWKNAGIDDYLPAAIPSGGENTTEPVAEQTMGPLLVWAMRMVDDLANDILTAGEYRRHLVQSATENASTPSGLAALRAYLDPLITTHALLPTTVNRGVLSLARSYICGLTGASLGQLDRLVLREQLLKSLDQRSGPCPLNVPVTGRISGKRWREVMDYNEIPELLRHLGTAAFIVCAYLTGMRPGEVLGLRRGCCPDPQPDLHGGLARHLVRSREFKTARDEHGNHLSAGLERDVPWVAITPVVNAIRVLERMAPDDGHLLFDVELHGPRFKSRTGAVKPKTLHTRIEAFVAWANREAANQGIPEQAIPPDPHGCIGTMRFRRSLAWHIARRPNGLVALAIQYGHLRTALVSGGYASRSRNGIHDLIDLETARAVVDTVTELHDTLQAGGAISGPAARRAIRAAANAPRFAGVSLTATSARRLLANNDLALFDNPHALLLCHYKRSTALCHRDDVKDAPSLDQCVPGCGNAVRTDTHAAQLRSRAAALTREADHVPAPIGDRLRATARKLLEHAEAHHTTGITPSQEPT